MNPFETLKRTLSKPFLTGSTNPRFEDSSSPVPVPVNATQPYTHQYRYQHLHQQAPRACTTSCVNLPSYVTATGLPAANEIDDDKRGYCCDLCRRMERE